MPQKTLRQINGLKAELIELQRELVARPALGPTNGGRGEKDKADFLLDWLSHRPELEINELNAPDERVDCGYRPNIAAVLPGRNKDKTLWIIGHMDVVPPGGASQWESDPFVLQVNGDRMIGRGTEDNHQGILSGLLLLSALEKTKIVPPVNLGLLFVADEETGSQWGLGWIMKHHPNLFGPNDSFLVPDVGSRDGSQLEIAEKSQLWIKVSVQGRQCHASRPDQGVNSLTAAAELILAVEDLSRELGKKTENPLFEPPRTTITPTRKDANVPNVNTMPGHDVFFIDARILPEEDVDVILDRIQALGQKIARKRGVQVDMEIVQREESPATAQDSPIVEQTARAVRKIYDVEPRLVGVGGGTVAAFLRRAGHPVVAWSTLQGLAHQPNEYALISSTIKDAQVMALVLFDAA